MEIDPCIDPATDKVQEYRDTGALLLREFIAPDRIAWLENRCSCLVNQAENGISSLYAYKEPHAATGKPILRRIEGLAEADQMLADYFSNGPIPRLIGRLLGEPVVLFKDKLNLKYPGGAGYAAHLDGHFRWRDDQGDERLGWCEYATSFASVVIPLEHSTMKNGCLEVATPWDMAAQRSIPLEDVIDGLDGDGPGLTADQESSIRFQPIEMVPGSILVFDWLLPHRSAPNRSDQSRRILYLTYHPARFGDQRSCYYSDKESSTASECAKGSI